MEKFSLGTTVVSGAGAVSFLETLKPRRLFLVTDPYFIRSGAAQKILEAAKPEASEIFGEVTPDPSVELAARGTAALKNFQPDLLVALGGGSTMDCAKAISYFGGSSAPMAAIPTTSGSGSEATDFAVLTHGEAKYPLVDPALRPAYAILDSDLLESLPRSLIADAGFDVLSHALEAAAAKNAGPVSELLAGEAFRTVYQNLPLSYQGRTDVRLSIHRAATMAGVAFNQAGLGLCHALSHSLGGMFHVPHGRLNAILLPAVLRANLPAAGHRYAVLAQKAGLGAAAETLAVRNLCSSLTRLRRELQLPATLREAGIAPGDIHSRLSAIVETAVKDPCSRTNPVPVTPELAERVLEEVTGRG